MGVLGVKLKQYKTMNLTDFMSAVQAGEVPAGTYYPTMGDGSWTVHPETNESDGIQIVPPDVLNPAANVHVPTEIVTTRLTQLDNAITVYYDKSAGRYKSFSDRNVTMERILSQARKNMPLHMDLVRIIALDGGGLPVIVWE